MWTMEAAVNADCVDFTVVTTESEEIEEIAREWAFHLWEEESYTSFDVIRRPDYLSADRVQTDEVLLNTMRQLSYQSINPMYTMMLQPTSPLRGADHVDDAMRVYLDSTANTLISGYYAPGKLYWKQVGDFDTYRQIEPVGHDPRVIIGSQFTPNTRRLVVENGAIYITDTNLLLNNRTRFTPPYAYYHMSREDSIDIDTEKDFHMAEAMLDLADNR